MSKTKASRMAPAKLTRVEVPKSASGKAVSFVYPDAPSGLQQAPCTIQFGHNVSVRQVIMLLSVAANQLIFSPEDAEDVAAKLQHYAKAARGEKPN
jgi:hypothetical protein